MTLQTKARLAQRRRDLAVYARVLPSLDLKRRQLAALLQQEQQARAAAAARKVAALERDAARLPMLAAAELPPAAWAALVQVDETQPPALQRVLGVALPQLEATRWRPAPLGIALPPWADEVAQALREQHDGQRELGRRDERIRRLDAAHRRTMQRVNLFERVLVPRARAEIRSIVVRLADLERAAIVRAKRSRALLRRHAAGAGTGP